MKKKLMFCLAIIGIEAIVYQKMIAQDRQDPYQAKLQRIYRTLGYETPEQRGTALWKMLQHCKKNTFPLNTDEYQERKKLCQQGKQKLESLCYQHTRLAPDDREGITDLVVAKEFFSEIEAVDHQKVVSQGTQDPYEIKLQKVYKKIGSEKPEAEGSELWEMLQHCNKSTSEDRKICRRGTHRLDYLNCQHTRVARDDLEGITSLEEIWDMLHNR